jgi:AbrB family looped-hinge helix DNA binding protein
METVTISSKFQIVIPRSIRESLGLRPGQKFQAIQYGNRIELVPVRPIREMRGFLKGIDAAVEHESGCM